MRKLLHQNSCHVTVEQSSNLEDDLRDKLRQTDLAPSSKQKEMRTLEGKILLLEERGKNIQQFYENKIAQLKTVLLKQNETKSQLMQELQKLTVDSQKQVRHISQLKQKLEDEKLNASLRLVKEMQPNNVFEASAEKYNAKKSSRGKVGLLFNSNNLRQSSQNKLTMKKAKSEQYLQSEYFMNQTHGKSQKSATVIQNPERVRAKYQQ